MGEDKEKSVLPYRKSFIEFSFGELFFLLKKVSQPVKNFAFDLGFFLLYNPF